MIWFRAAVFIIGQLVLVLLLLEICFVTNQSVKNNSRIISGTVARDKKWPFIAAILYAKHMKTIWCGGTVINCNTILTAAHCLKGHPNEYVVYVGHQDIGKIDVKYKFYPHKFIKHESYNWKIIANDIAAIKLKGRIRFDKMPLVQRVCLSPWTGTNDIDIHNCFVVGWGDTEIKGEKMPTHLKELKLPILDNATCAKHAANYNPNLMVCAGYFNKGKGTCYGDSGSPLFCPFKWNPRIYAFSGITSFGFNCTKGNNPSYFTKVASYTKWIIKRSSERIWTGKKEPDEDDENDHHHDDHHEDRDEDESEENDKHEKD